MNKWILILTGLVFLVTGCSTMEIEKQPKFAKNLMHGRAKVLTVDEELGLANQIMPEILKDYPRLNDPEIQYYVETLGRRIVDANNLDGQPYTYSFNVVTVPTPAPAKDAFAIPAGTIFVTASMLETASSEAQLASILAREIAHITSRDIARRMSAAQDDDRAYHGVGGGVLGGAIGYGVDRQQQKYDFLKPSAQERVAAEQIAAGYVEQAGFTKQKSSSRDFKSIQKKARERARAANRKKADGSLNAQAGGSL